MAKGFAKCRSFKKTLMLRDGSMAGILRGLLHIDCVEFISSHRQEPGQWRAG